MPATPEAYLLSPLVASEQRLKVFMMPLWQCLVIRSLGETNLGASLLFLWDIQYDCIYQNGIEKNNSLCLFVPGGATAVPYWDIWALAC